MALKSAHQAGAKAMPQIGDSVTVIIQGAAGSGTALSGGSSSGIKIGPGAQMRIPGKIVEDQGEHWVVELSMSLEGKNRVLIRKDAQR